MIYEIIISEPWNFKSSDGDNILKVDVLGMENDIIRAKAISEYPGKEGYLLIKPRNSFESITSSINLKEIPIIHLTASEATEYYNKRE